jgi:pimeloyl-ACP methyl ester carboxylesterase
MSDTTPKFASRRFIASRRGAASGPPLTIVGLEPVSHYYYSDRLKLQFWDWGQDNLPPLLLVHGGLDHARNWDWVARSLREHFHVYAMDLRGHGNSAWAPGAMYSVAEHVLDLATLVDLLSGDAGGGPVHLIGHSLGGIVTLSYAGLYPDHVRKVIAIEGLGFPVAHRIHKPAAERMRIWIDNVRKTEQREPQSYPTLEAAVARMKEANPHLSEEVAQHLTVHGTNWNSDGSLSWKFDNYVRSIPPYGHDIDDQRAVYGEITCPVLLVWGRESWMPDPDTEDRALAIPNRQVLKVDGAGHWVHHDRLELFLEESTRFLLRP